MVWNIIIMNTTWWWYMMYDVWCMIYDVGCRMYDVRCMKYDIWFMIYDVWCMMMYDVWCMIYDIWYMMYDVWYMIYIDIWYIDVKSDHIICWHGEGKWSHCWKNKTSLLSSPFFWIPWVWTRRVLQVENAHGELSSIGWWKLATSIIDDRWWQMAELPIDWCSIFFSCVFCLYILNMG